MTDSDGNLNIITYHPNDWGGENIALSKGINKYTKHHCRCITEKEHTFKYDTDIVLNNCSKESLCEIITLLQNADFFHLSSTKPVWLLDYLKQNNHLIQFRGGDIRGYHATQFFKDQLQRYTWSVTGKGDFSLARCTPLPVTHIPNFIIDCEEWKPIKKKNDKVLIFHSPTSNYLKGTLHINMAIEKLKKKYDVDYVYTGCDNAGHGEKAMCWRDVMKQKQIADISIDQLRIGALGKNYVESCCVGTPTVGYMDHYWLSHFPNTPVVNATIDNIYEKLEMLILDDKLRRDIGKKSREFCERTHHAKVVCQQYVELYQWILNPDTRTIDEYLQLGLPDQWIDMAYNITPKWDQIRAFSRLKAKKKVKDIAMIKEE